MMTEILQTDRLLLRDWEMADAEALFEICSHAEVMLHIGTGKPYGSLDEARSFLRWAAAHQQENGFCRWAVVEKSTRKVVGSCGFARLEGGEIDLGYLFARQAWGKGYATEAAGACLRYGFEQLRFSEVIATIDPGHTASQHVLEKIGFRRRGIRERDGELDEVYVKLRSEA